MQYELLREILFRISDGTASPAEVQLWKEWISQPHIQAQSLVSEEEIEQRLRIDMAKPDWEKFLKQQQHNLIHYEEKEKTQPGNSYRLIRKILPGRKGMNLIIKMMAAIIIGVMLYTATYLVISTLKNENNHLAATEYKTIHSPAGKTTAYTLPDGTKVWLNTNTTLRYHPSAFTDCNRKVELNGEAYFDVAKDAERPFIVYTDSSKTLVLGTRFNVDAYKGSGILKVSLLEGSVLVGKRDESTPKKLNPGEQTVFNNGSFNVVKMSRPEETTAWQRDSFAFDQARLVDIMHELAQYYDFKVQIDKEIENLRFTVGVTERAVPVMPILRGLERTRAFRIHPKKSFIAPGETIFILKNE